jgi:hypothetical protein
MGFGIDLVGGLHGKLGLGWCARWGRGGRDDERIG